jgi:hypothetical protein
MEPDFKSGSSQLETSASFIYLQNKQVALVRRMWVTIHLIPSQYLRISFVKCGSVVGVLSQYLRFAPILRYAELSLPNDRTSNFESTPIAFCQVVVNITSHALRFQVCCLIKSQTS